MKNTISAVKRGRLNSESYLLSRKRVQQSRGEGKKARG